MKIIECEIKGLTPLLMHSAENMGVQKVTKNPAKQYDDKEEAEKVAYRNKKGELVVPSRCLKACFVNGASWFKIGKQGMKPLIAGCTRIEPVELGLGTKTYDIDRRPVNIQKAKIMRVRPRFDKWSLKFNIVYNENIFATKDALDKMKQILEEAGQRIGILDFRPQKYGDCGTFKVVKWEVK